MIRLDRRHLLIGTGLALAAPVRAADAPVVVSSKIDVEGGIIGAMILQVLRTAGIPVVDRLLLGPTAILRQAILAGAVDLYPEYTGNAAFFFNKDGDPVWKDAQAGYHLAADLDKAKNDLIWLPPAPTDNTWVIAVPATIAAAHGLASLGDFARWVNEGPAGGVVKLAASAEFVESAAGLPAFEAAYGFRLDAEQLLVLSGGETSATMKAASSGISGVNAAMAYSTDGALTALHLIPLTDNKHAQPVYAPAALVRGSVLDRYPAIAAALKPVFAGLDLATLRRLNERVAVEGDQAANVATSYLKSLG